MKTAAQITDEGLFSWSSNISLKRDMDWYSVSSSSVDDLIKINSPADICAGHWSLAQLWNFRLSEHNHQRFKVKKARYIGKRVDGNTVMHLIDLLSFQVLFP